MVKEPLTPEQISDFKKEWEQQYRGPSKPPTSPLWWWVTPCIALGLLLVGLCVVVSVVAGTVWLVRQALGV